MLPDWFVCSKCGKKPPEVREFHFGDEVVCSLCGPPKEKEEGPIAGPGGFVGERNVWRITYDTSTSDRYSWLVIASTVEDAIKTMRDQWNKDFRVELKIRSIERLGEVKAGE